MVGQLLKLYTQHPEAKKKLKMNQINQAIKNTPLYLPLSGLGAVPPYHPSRSCAENGANKTLVS